MAVVSYVSPSYSTPSTPGLKVVVYNLRNISTGDTFAVANDLYRVVAVTAFDTTRSLATFTPTISGTTLTLTSSGLANDDIVLVVLGSSVS